MQEQLEEANARVEELTKGSKLGRAISEYTWEELAAITAPDSGYTDDELKFLIGQVRHVAVEGYGALPFVCIGLRHDVLEDGITKAGLTFICGVIAYKINTGGNFGRHKWDWGNTQSASSNITLTSVRMDLNSSFYDAIENDVKECIKNKRTYYNSYFKGTSYEQLKYNDTEYAVDKIFIPSINELSGDNNIPNNGTVYEYFATADKRELIRGETFVTRTVRPGGYATHNYIISSYNSNMGAVQTKSMTSSEYEHCSVVPCFCI